MIWKEKNGVAWLEYEILQDTKLKHAVFLKKGGVSTGPFASLNLGDKVGDEEGAVIANKKRIQEIIGSKKLLFANQIHGNDVKIITDSMQLDGVDGMATSNKGIAIAIRHADCQATIFYDPIREVVANVHAGWRGNVNNIYEKVIALMRTAFGSKPEDLLVCISPSLGPRCAEFIHYKKEFPESFWDYQVSPNYFDLWQIATDQLLALGVLGHHIEVAKICTFENADFFSYRRDKITGRHATVAML